VHTSADLVDVGELDTRRLPQDLLESWQGRVIAAATWRQSMAFVRARDEFGAILLSIMAHSFDSNDAWIVLLHCIHPYFKALTGTIVCSTGRIDKAGRVVADVARPGGVKPKRTVLFRREADYRSSLRQFADRMKFTDQERLEFFTVARRWLAADMRRDPTMDPADPDAKRLVEA